MGSFKRKLGVLFGLVLASACADPVDTASLAAGTTAGTMAGAAGTGGTTAGTAGTAGAAGTAGTAGTSATSDAGTIVNSPGPRQESSSVLLDDGRVLVVGGVGLNARALDDTWLFDPETLEFSQGPTLSEVAGANPVVTKLDDGRVLVGSGRRRENFEIVYGTNIEIFTPGPDSLTKVGDLQPHQGCLASAFFIRGGDDAGSAGFFCVAETSPTERDMAFHVMNLESGASRVVTSTPTIGQAITALANGQVLLAGGRQRRGLRGQASVTLDTAVIYDPTTHTFTEAPGRMSEAKLSMISLPLANGQIMHLRGRLDSGEDSTRSEIFNPVTGQFRQGPAWPGTDFVLQPGTQLVPEVVPLGDGRVLLMNGNTEALSWIVDAQGTRIDLHPDAMELWRALFTATALNDTQVLAVGGQNIFLSPIVIDGAELFQP